MYIQSAFKVQHDWWRYLIGVGVAIIGIFIFSVPHLVAITMKVMQGNADEARLNDTNYILQLFEPNLNLIFMLLPFVGGLLCLLLIVKVLHRQSAVQLTTARDRIDWSRVWFAFVLWGVVSVAMILLDYLLTPEDYVLNFKLQPFIILCVIAVIMIPLQTSFEEYLFRGYLMQGLGVTFKSRWLPLFFTSIVFGLLHIANPEIEKLGYILMVYYIGTGLFLGITTLMDDGLELALGFHAANNLFTALLVTADWTAFQTHSVLKDISEPTAATGAEVFIPVFVVFPIMLIIFGRKYNWSDWNQKLFGRIEKPVEVPVETPAEELTSGDLDSD